MRELLRNKWWLLLAFSALFLVMQFSEAQRPKFKNHHHYQQACQDHHCNPPLFSRSNQHRIPAARPR